MLITFFNRFVDIDLLEKELGFGSIIKSKTLVFTKDVRLRRGVNGADTIALSVSDYRTNLIQFSYGVMYDIDITKEDLFTLEMIHPLYYKRKIEVFEYEATLEGFIKDKINPTGKSFKSYCFVGCKDVKAFNIAHKCRNRKVNFNKRLLINLI